MIILGVDVGLTGALAAIDNAGTCAVDDLPTAVRAIGNRSVKTIDARATLELLRRYVPPGEKAFAMIEDLHAGVGPGSLARSSLMRSMGTLEAVLELARVEVVHVSPQKWKRFYGLTGKGKERSLETAVRLYPMAAGALKRKRDHNRAEALLLAHYALPRVK